jgi:hypothetical protein
MSFFAEIWLQQLANIARNQLQMPQQRDPLKQMGSTNSAFDPQGHFNGSHYIHRRLTKNEQATVYERAYGFCRIYETGQPDEVLAFYNRHRPMMSVYLRSQQCTQSSYESH